MLVDDPTLALQGLDMPTGISTEAIRGDYFNLMQLSVFEIAWYTHLHSQLTDDYFNSWAASMTEVAKRPAFQAMWQSGRLKILHSGFREYMDKMLR
jgi:hypothetical protein